MTTTRDTSFDDAAIRLYVAVCYPTLDSETPDSETLVTGEEAERLFGIDRYELAWACETEGRCDLESDQGRAITLVPVEPGEAILVPKEG